MGFNSAFKGLILEAAVAVIQSYVFAVLGRSHKTRMNLYRTTSAGG